MNAIGAPELLLVIGTLFFWIVPLVALGWGLVTLRRIDVTQRSMQQTLAALEKKLRQAP